MIAKGVARHHILVTTVDKLWLLTKAEWAAVPINTI